MRIIVLLGQELYGVGRDKEKLVSCKSQRRWWELPSFWQLKVNA